MEDVGVTTVPTQLVKMKKCLKCKKECEKRYFCEHKLVCENCWRKKK